MLALLPALLLALLAAVDFLRLDVRVVDFFLLATATLPGSAGVGWDLLRSSLSAGAPFRIATGLAPVTAPIESGEVYRQHPAVASRKIQTGLYLLLVTVLLTQATTEAKQQVDPFKLIQPILKGAVQLILRHRRPR